MECSETRSLSPRESLGPLMTQYIEVQKELKETGSQRRRRHLRRELDNLRTDLGWALMDCGRNEEGLAMYSFLSWKEHGEVKCNGMSRALVGLGRHDEAARLLEAGLRRYPGSSMLWVAKGAFYASLEDTCESMKCFDRAILLAPEGSWEALYNKAICLEKFGSYEEAVPIIEGLIAKYPGDPKFLSERGYCAMEMGYPQEALQYYRSAMDSWSEDPDVYIGVNIYAGLCVAYTELGLKKEAAEIALEGLKKFPDEDPILYQNVGATFWEMGWKEESREVLKEGVEKFPENEELKKILEDVDDDVDDPDNGVKPPLLGLILLTALIYKRMRGGDLRNFKRSFTNTRNGEVLDMAKWKALVIAEKGTLGFFLSAILKKEDFDVTVVDSFGPGSLQAVYEEISAKKYDLILPTNNGLTPPKILGLVTEIRKKDPDGKIIVLSGYHPPEFVRELEEKDIDGFLPRPFPSEDLVRRVKESLMH